MCEEHDYRASAPGLPPRYHLVMHCLHLHGQALSARVRRRRGIPKFLDVRDGVADQGHLVHLRDLEDHCTQGVDQLIQLLPPLPLRLYSICYL